MILHDNLYHFIDGNKFGAILLDYLIKSRHSKNEVVYKTIAISRLSLKICEAHDISIIETNVDFKWIGQAIKENKMIKTFRLRMKNHTDVLLMTACETQTESKPLL